MTTPLRTARLCVLAAVIALMSVAGFAAPAGAHAGDQSYLYLDITSESISGRVELAYLDMRGVFGLDLEGSDEELLAEILDNESMLRSYLLEHVEVGDGNWSIDFTETTLFEFEDVTEPYAVFFFDVDTAGEPVSRVFDVTFDPFLDEVPDRSHLLLIGNDWDGGVIENGEEALLAYDSNSRTQTVNLGNTSQWRNFTASVELGFDHIKTGPDHILFVLALVLPSVLVFSTRWNPAPSFGRAFWRVLKIMTMFTVAHSITFTLAGLDILPLPSPRITESIIALSIAAAALHNIRPLAANREWLIAFTFGLFHGMGFASLVESLEISRATQLVSLLGRNVGIEIGQAAVIALVFPGLFLLRRTRFFRPFFTVSSIGLAVISLGWGYERIVETDIGVSGIIDPFLEPDRAVPLIVIFTIAAAVIERRERASGNLLPVHEDDAPAAEPELAGV